MAVGGVTTVAGLVIAVIPDDCDDKFLCFKSSEIGGFIALTGLAIFAIGAIGAGVNAAEAPPPQVVNAPPPPFDVTATPPGEGGAGLPIAPPPPSTLPTTAPRARPRLPVAGPAPRWRSRPARRLGATTAGRRWRARRS